MYIYRSSDHYENCKVSIGTIRTEFNSLTHDSTPEDLHFIITV